MGRRLLVCAPLVSATLVGCLVRPSPGVVARDGGHDSDGGSNVTPTDGSTLEPCPGAGTVIDSLVTGMCGAGSANIGGSGSLQATDGTLTASTGRVGSATCSWLSTNTSFAGAVVRVESAPGSNGAAFLSYSDGFNTYAMTFANGTKISTTGGWMPGASIPFSAPMCARIYTVPVGSGGSGGSMLEGEVYSAGSWQRVASQFEGGSMHEVTLGVWGSGATATFDKLDEIVPGSE